VNRTFRSKVDTWLIWVLILGVGLSIVVLVAAAILERKFYLIPIGLMSPLLIWICAWPMEYTLERDRLVIRSGFIRKAVPYADIRSVEPTRNPLSAPALSLDRLMIRRRKGSGVMISPDDRETFLRELKEKAKLAV
jgi:hypothetical protein